MKVAPNIKWVCGLLITSVLSVGVAAAQTTPIYSIIGRIPGSGGSWDYATVDEDAARFYLAQQGVTALDLRTNKITTGLLAGGVTHGILPLGDGTVAVDDSAHKTITVFGGVSGKVLATIPTAQFDPASGRHTLDAMVLEPKSGLVIAVNGESGLLLLVDVKQVRVVGTISVGGKPEYAAADGSGHVYVNVNNEGGKTSEIVVVDILARKVVRRIPLSGCEGSTGLAYDQEDRLVISVCENGVAKFIQAESGRETASVSVGKGADAVLFDPRRRRAFVPGAADGTLSVIAVRAADDIAVVQSLATQKGTRLGAVDIDTGRLYLPAAKFGPPVPPSPYPTVISGTFEILVVAPN